MKIHKRFYTDTVLITLSGQMTGNPDEQKLVSSIQQDVQRQHKKFIIETEAVNFINAEGVRTLTNCSIAIRKNGLKPILSAPSKTVLDTLRMNSLTDKFVIANSTEDAMTIF